MATLEELEKRIQRLQDIRQVERLQRIYGYYRDYQEWGKVVDLFSENAESVEECDYGVYKGKESIRRYYLEFLKGGPDAAPRHGYMSIGMQLQGVVTVEPDGVHAKGRWYGFFLEARPTLSLHDGDLRQLWAHGIYENEYIKENGTWLISKLYFFLNFRTPYEDGWLKTPVVGHNGPSFSVPPDTPPTNWRPFPLGYHLPVHFKHPVTGK